MFKSPLVAVNESVAARNPKEHGDLPIENGPVEIVDLAIQHGDFP